MSSRRLQADASHSAANPNPAAGTCASEESAAEACSKTPCTASIIATTTTSTAAAVVAAGTAGAAAATTTNSGSTLVSEASANTTKVVGDQTIGDQTIGNLTAGGLIVGDVPGFVASIAVEGILPESCSEGGGEGGGWLQSALREAFRREGGPADVAGGSGEARVPAQVRRAWPPVLLGEFVRRERARDREFVTHVLFSCVLVYMRTGCRVLASRPSANRFRRTVTVKLCRKPPTISTAVAAPAAQDFAGPQSAR